LTEKRTDFFEKIKNSSSTPKIEIYTDGACSGNPGPGGWGVVFIFEQSEESLCGGEPQTTNNRMEMMAAIEALQSLPVPCNIDLYTDSMYLRDGLNLWIKKWKENGWVTANKKPVKNQDLWLILDQLQQKHMIQWHWVRGHDGNEYNEKADDLARSSVITQQLKFPQ
jgi:ribonuclease HI